MTDRVLALVDFDRTLVREDTLRILFRLMTKRSLSDVVRHAWLGKRWRFLGLHRAVKEQMYREILADRREQDLHQAARQLATQLHVNEPVFERLAKLRNDGAEVIVATASLETVIMTVVRHLDLPVDRVFGSYPRIEFGIYSGELLGGECQRAVKAHRIVSELGEQLCKRHSIAFGNLPADREMLELANEAYVVHANDIRSFRKSNPTRRM